MLVGRQGELSLLQDRLARGDPMVLVGEAGVGKTALMRAAVAQSGRRLFEGGGLSTVSWLPLLALERAVGEGLEPGNPASLANEVERRVGDGVLLLDDLQWVDPETRRVLPFLARRSAILTAVRRGDPAAPMALEELTTIGAESLEVEPLDRGSARHLFETLRPDLPSTQVERIIDRAGGNPLLLEELAATGEPSESLKLALAFRLRHLSDDGRRAMGLLSLIGRPIDDALIGEGADELVDVGLAVIDGDVIAVRHALLAEAMVEQLPADERRELHAAIAAALDDDGEAARHHAGAGDLARAHAHAVAAADKARSAGERAPHLELAAVSARGADADTLRIAAAEALADVGLDARAVELLDGLESPRPEFVALRHLLESRVCQSRRDLDRAVVECEAGLALVAGGGSEIEIRLALEDAQITQGRVLHFDADPSIARAKAERALELAVGTRQHEARARRLSGSIGLVTQAPGWDDDFRLALELAQGEADIETELRTIATFSFALILSGRPAEAISLSADGIARAHADHATEWERALRRSTVGARWHLGELRTAIVDAEALFAEREQDEDSSFYLCQILADVGRVDDAVMRARACVTRAHPTWQSLGNALWALTDAALAAGHAREALGAADEALERFGAEGPSAFLQVSRAWARHDLDLAPESPALVAGQPIVEGAPLEIEGICLMDEGRALDASESFSAAATAWSGRHFRGELRSLWAAGEALRVADRTADAVQTLERAERLAVEHGAETLLRRIRRSLRLSGANRSATRSQVGSLTGREREVLALVGVGLSNAVIARRLGVGRPTVARLVQSAVRKLGAQTRAQAAAIAARE